MVYLQGGFLHFKPIGVYLKGVYQACSLPDGILNVLPLLRGNGGMSCWALVGHQDPEEIPQDPKTAWEREGDREKSLRRRIVKRGT